MGLHRADGVDADYRHAELGVSVDLRNLGPATAAGYSVEGMLLDGAGREVVRFGSAFGDVAQGDHQGQPAGAGGGPREVVG